jgi:putative FmdB family regulatory protein
MPIYEYRCENGHTFETIQRMSDEPLASCEACDAPAARVLHAPAVHFKGSGFYNTDYGTKKRARELKSSGEGKGGGDKSTSSTATSDAASSSSSDGATAKSSSTSADSSAS